MDELKKVYIELKSRIESLLSIIVNTKYKHLIFFWPTFGFQNCKVKLKKTQHDAKTGQHVQFGAKCLTQALLASIGRSKRK